jgi:hypothetical protein
MNGRAPFGWNPRTDGMCIVIVMEPVRELQSGKPFKEGVVR